MPLWYLQVLGTPLLTPSGDSSPPVRFRYRDTWVLLASLALDPAMSRRDSLIHRLALDNKSQGKDKFRFRLNDLRHGAPQRGKSEEAFCGIGLDNVRTEGERVWLSPGVVTTDLQEVARVLQEARPLGAALKAECLRRVVTHLRGGFLEGYELVGSGDGWLEQMRFEAERLAAEVWLELARALDQVGERRGAFEAVRKAYTLRPETPEVLELLLDLAEGAHEQEEILSLSKRLGVEVLLPRLEALEREGQTLTVSEEIALREAVQTRLSQLSTKTVVDLKVLSCFPQEFTIEQAQAIAQVTPETLERIRHAFPLRREGEYYSLLPVLQMVLRQGVVPEAHEAFRERHAKYFFALLGTGEVSKKAHSADWVVRLRREEGHLIAAIRWFTEHPPSRQGLVLIQASLHWTNGSSRVKAVVKECKGYLQAAFETLTGDTARLAAELLGGLAIHYRDFTEAVYWLRITLEQFEQPDQHAWLAILIATHHAQQDALFDTIAELILTQGSLRNSMEPSVYLRFKEAVLHQITENYAARGRLTEALEHNRSCFALCQKLGIEPLPSRWAQRGNILARQGQWGEAESCWDKALLGYEALGDRGGVAECYRELGILSVQQGRHGLGISLVRQAIHMFEEVGNEGAVAASQGVLGDILLGQGKLEEAQQLYQAGFAFWKEQGHARWIEKFASRMTHLWWSHLSRHRRADF